MFSAKAEQDEEIAKRCSPVTCLEPAHRYRSSSAWSLVVLQHNLFKSKKEANTLVVSYVRHAMMALCTRCERFDIYSFSNGFFSRTYDFSGVNLSVVNGNGCSFCRLLLESLEATEYISFGERGIRRAFEWPPHLRVQFWITRSQASVIGGSGLRMTHLNAAIGEKCSSIESSRSEIISFHAAADPGEHSKS